MGRHRALQVGLAWASVVMVAGCAEPLTPALVRELLDEPRGTVSNETMAFITRDLFAAERGTSLEGFALGIRSSGEGSESSGAAESSGGALDGIGDAFCIGGFVAGAATFDACSLGDACDAELTVDSCLLRVGAAGPDEDARGKLKFRLMNSVDDAFERSELGVRFEGWESSRDDEHLNTIAGQLAVETARALDDRHLEFTVAADVETAVKRKERGLFDDGIEESARFAVGVHFVAEQDETSARGQLDVLASASEDGARDASVTVTLEAEGREVDATTATASATVSIIGENGTFSCTWDGASTVAEGSREGLKVTSAGTCTDEDGETFSFDGEVIAR